MRFRKLTAGAYLTCSLRKKTVPDALPDAKKGMNLRSSLKFSANHSSSFFDVTLVMNSISSFLATGRFSLPMTYSGR